jgi:mono/diheme cytochrome c family protein
VISGGVPSSYAAYYNEVRTHLALGKDAPVTDRGHCSHPNLALASPPFRADMIFGRHRCNDMRTTWCVALFAASTMMGTIDVLHAQPEENPGRNEFLRSCASCHGVSGKGDGPVAKSLSSPPSDLTRLSEANNGVFPVSRVHEVIDGRIERLVHGTRDMPVWGDRYMQEMKSPESGGWVSKEWDEAIVRRRILALVEYISTLQRATRRSR